MWVTPVSLVSVPQYLAKSSPLSRLLPSLAELPWKALWVLPHSGKLFSTPVLLNNVYGSDLSVRGERFQSLPSLALIITFSRTLALRTSLSTCLSFRHSGHLPHTARTLPPSLPPEYEAVVAQAAWEAEARGL